jgi:prepilin-type N-terminal cleavage/methylation domain-containing protein
MKFFGKKSQSGFSLVELMIVVGIIGVLATLALPRFKQFQAKAKMAEAMNVLQHVYTLEQSYSLDNNVYLTMGVAGADLTKLTGGTNTCNFTSGGIANAAALGLKIEPCVAAAPTPRFQYEVTGGGATFLAIARTGDDAANRICTGNKTFSIGLSDQNATSYAAASGTPSVSGQAQIGAVCPL